MIILRLRKNDETRNYLQDEMNDNDLTSKNIKRYICKYLNYLEHLLIFVSTATSCFSISAFPWLACVPVGIV